MHRRTVAACHTAMFMKPARLMVVLAGTLLAACASPWIQVARDTPVYSTADIPLGKLRTQTDQYAGTVLEGRFKFYRIYHNRDTADIAAREQVIEGKTHFTARPIDQYLYVIQVQITPAQEQWILAQHIERQDVIRARVRFAGIAPGGVLAFDLLQVLQP
jgi:hypothetical protein